MRQHTSASRSNGQSEINHELERRRRIFSEKPPRIDTMGGCYMPIPHAILDKILDLLVVQFGNRGVFVDAGSGDGRVIAAAFYHGFRRCVGIELDTKVFEMGRRRLLQFFDGRIPSGIRMVRDDFTHAESYGLDIRDINLIYHFINRRPLAELVRLMESDDFRSAKLVLVDFSGQEQFDGFEAVFRAIIDDGGRPHYATVYQRMG